MAKSSYKISGVGQKQQIRNTVISGKGDAAVNWKLTLSGFDGADLLKGIEEGIDRANQIVAA